MPLVVKHIEAVLRRAEQGAGVETNILRYKDLTLDTDSFTVLVKDESVSLTIREFEILKLLVENQGRVSVSYTHLDVYKRQGYCSRSASLSGSGTGKGSRTMISDDTISPGKSTPSQQEPAANSTAFWACLKRWMTSWECRQTSISGKAIRPFTWL